MVLVVVVVVVVVVVLALILEFVFVLVLPLDFNIIAMLRKYQDFMLRSWVPQNPNLGQILGLGNMWLSSSAR